SCRTRPATARTVNPDAPRPDEAGAELDSLPPDARTAQDRWPFPAGFGPRRPEGAAMSAPRTYELVYIIAPDATDEQVEAVHQQVESTVQRLGGTLEKTDNWGRRKL